MNVFVNKITTSTLDILLPKAWGRPEEREKKRIEYLRRQNELIGKKHLKTPFWNGFLVPCFSTYYNWICMKIILNTNFNPVQIATKFETD